MCCACSTRQRRSLPFLRVLLERLFVDVQHLAIGAVADRVDAHLIAGVERRLRAPPHAAPPASSARPDAVGLVGVRLEQPRAARSERAVAGDLDRAHRQHVVAVADDAVGRERFGSYSRDHHPQPHVHPAGVDHPLDAVDDLEAGPGVLETGDALRDRLPDRPARARGGRALRLPPASASARRRRGGSGATPSRAAGPSACRPCPSGSRRRSDSPCPP